MNILQIPDVENSIIIILLSLFQLENSRITNPI